jgi:hypothetical protein
MSDGNTGRNAFKDARRHNLHVLNPDRRRPTLAPSMTAIERDRGLRFILHSAVSSTPDRLADAIWSHQRLVV